MWVGALCVVLIMAGVHGSFLLVYIPPVFFTIRLLHMNPQTIQKIKVRLSLTPCFISKR